MIKSQYIRPFGVVTFYDDRPFTISPHSDNGIDLLPNEGEYRKEEERLTQRPLGSSCEKQRSLISWFTMQKILMNSLNHRVVYLAMKSWLKPEFAFTLFGNAAIQPVKNVRKSIRLSSVQLATQKRPTTGGEW